MGADGGTLLAVDPTTIQLWVLRVGWVLVALVAGTALRSTFDPLDSSTRLVFEVALWVGWFVGAVSLLAPHPISLTIIRVLSPTVAGVGLLSGLFIEWGTGALIVFGVGVIVTIVSLLPAIGDVMVNGSAYGSERRMALRPPAVVLIGPVPVGWLLIFLGLTVWAPLLAADRPLVAAAAAAGGAVPVWLGGRLLHQLARRWIVFVPAGFVIHDPFQLAEPVLLARARISRLGPAEVSDAATGETNPSVDLDLSAGSTGLALEVETIEPTSFGVRRNRAVEVTNSTRVVFSPTLPGALLSEARVRGIKIKGSSGPG